MARVLAPGGFLAVIDGDEARDAPWQSEWAGFLRHWLGRLGRAYDPGGHREWMSEFQPWMDVAGRRTFDCRFSQTMRRVHRVPALPVNLEPRQPLGPDLDTRIRRRPSRSSVASCGR
ncbi:MAG: hypothetical protein R2849_04945 [Thermomicrobiales bacterium]